MKMVSEEYKAEISNKIIEALKNGTAPFQKPWIDNVPFNAVTGREYRGINSISLSLEQAKLSENGDTRWATKQQAESKGWSIKYGAKPTKIFVLILPKKKVVHSKILGDRVVSDRKSAIRKVFEVYHASQIKGIPPFVRGSRKQVIENQVIEEIVFNASARIFFGGTEAYYSPQDDVIRMPNKQDFVGTEAYYSTLLHELAHWTGHSSRLCRFFSWARKNEDYAREELVAEIASMMLSVETGLDQTQEHFKEHTAYVGSWISLLEADPNAIFQATQEAGRAVNFIMSFHNDEQEKISA